MTMKELEPILQKHLDTLEEIKALQKRAKLEEQELIGIMNTTGQHLYLARTLNVS